MGKIMIHIHAPKGHYIGQVRARGYKLWTTVTSECKSANAAMVQAVMAMELGHFRARVIFVVESGYYEPNVVMELKCTNG